jgi:hypothetical protein
MANYAFIDWKDNMDILDDAPSVYYPIVCEGSPRMRFAAGGRKRSASWLGKYGLRGFLEERRKLWPQRLRQRMSS